MMSSLSTWKPQESSGMIEVDLIGDKKKTHEKFVPNGPARDRLHGQVAHCKESLSNIMATYDHCELIYRLENVIVNHSEKNLPQCTFYLYWPDMLEHNHALRVTLTLAESFKSGYSRFMNEADLLQFVPAYQTRLPEQKYYRLSVDEMSMNGLKSSDVEVLTIWFTLDGLIGELKNIHKGHSLRGDEVMKVYEYFAEFLKLHTTYIYDDARFVDEKKKAAIPIRLIRAIAFDHTWFEKHLSGLTLFNIHDWKDAQQQTISQDNQKRRIALRELQSLTIEKWLQMLDKTEAKALKSLYHRAGMPMFRKNEITVKQLAAAVYTDADDRHLVTENLCELTRLLCGDINPQYHEMDEVEKNHYVRSRSYQLLWQSCIWKKTREISEMNNSFHLSMLQGRVQ